jgi:T-complex protein 1 subunit alpha
MSTALNLNGMRTQGKDVRMANITAVTALANIVKSSLGPQGLDKMLVDEIGDVTITNDGATILRQIEVDHPSARIMVELSQLQDQEVGDGTTSVVIIASELLKRAYSMIQKQIHPSLIISGYKTACKQAIKYLKNNLSVDTKTLGDEGLKNVAQTCMSSKLIGGESEFFSDLCVRAMQCIKSKSGKYPVKAVNIVKAHGKSSLESEFFPGYVTRMSRVSQQMPIKVDNAKIAFVDFNLSKFRLAMGIQVQVEDPKSLEEIRRREQDILKERLDLIIKSGANVIFTTKAMDDIASKYLVKNNIMGMRRMEGADLRRIARATGGTVVQTLANNDGTESFDVSNLGQAECVYEENLGDVDYIFVKNPQGSSNNTCTLLLRGANEYMLDEIDRSIHDALCVLKRTMESGQVVAGGGAVETALSVFLENMALKSTSKDLAVIAEFAEALLIIPKQLALNAALDATDLLSKLLVLHSTYQNNPLEKKYHGLQYTGLDLDEGKVRNNLNAGVLEPMMNKRQALKFATEAAISILRIDDLIKIAPEQKEK